MAAQIIDGKQIAAEIKAGLKREVEELKNRGVAPGLATLLVGDNAASQIYVKSKHKACAEAGIQSFNHTLPKETDTQTVLDKIREMNADRSVDGILVQLPLPAQIDADRVLAAVDPHKDADGFHVQNLGRMFSAKDARELLESKNPIPLPCTPYGCIVLIQKTGVAIKGLNAVVLGRSLIVGKPAAMLLLGHHATVTMVHSQTRNLAEACRGADILVAAIGKPRMVTADMVKPGAVVIDVGINRNADGSLCGDVDFDSVKEKASWITPVPGGVGPMTIAMLLKNTVMLSRRRLA